MRALPIFALLFAWGLPGRSAVLDGQARFEILAPNLVRMEYSPGGRFTDEPTTAVQKRDWPETASTTSRTDGWLEIKTARLSLRYRSGSGAFTASNLVVHWRDEDGEHSWKPGDKDDRNLGGIAGDIAGRAVEGQEPGPLSRNGFYLLDDSRTAIWDRAIEWVRPRPEQAGQDWYFFAYGRDFKGMLGQFSQLLGPIPMVPRYALGTWFGSRVGYSSDQWKMIANRFREESIPLDMLVLDSDSVSKVVWSGYDWDYEQMPDPKEFFAWMRERGFHVTMNEHYGALTPQNFQGFEKVRQLMGLPPGTAKIEHNLADKKYAQAFMDLMHKPALDAGLSFWWQDGNAHADMPGLDATLWTRHVEYEGQERITGKRSMVFCRLGTPPWTGYPAATPTPSWGVHRYGAYFSGDLVPHWSTLELLIPFNVRAANTLVAYPNNLNGGVIREALDSEIYNRWLQFSSFSPLFWWHGLWGQRLPWEYGPESVEIARRYMQLRYRLLPYSYTYSRMAHETGVSLVRGTYVEYPEQEQAYTYRHQYMYGRELLAAPVAEPGYGKPVLKDVYLPAGENWFDYHTGRIYSGGRTVPYEAPLERMPLFVKAGSILPLAPEMDSSEQKSLDPLTLDVYAGKSAEFRLYEDDGVSLDYRKHAYAWTPLTYTASANFADHLITVGPVEGSYAGQLKARRYEIRVHGLLQPQAVLVNGRELERKEPAAWGDGWSWDAKTRVATIRPAESQPVTRRMIVTLKNAGTFDDALALQRVLEFRERVRRVKQDEKLKYAMLLDGLDHNKPPRVIRETEKVEALLDALAASPHALAARVPDFRALTRQILHAFVDQPFEAQRTIPAPDEESREAGPKIANAKFEPWELNAMIGKLLGFRLAAKASGQDDCVLIAKLEYDEETVGKVYVSYQLELPDKGVPGWAQSSRTQRPDGYSEFNIRVPYPPDRRAQKIGVKAILSWEGVQAETARELDWIPLGG
jgi:alpha-glucosidase (family GH31 glycosyl hydrolase)